MRLWAGPDLPKSNLLLAGGDLPPENAARLWFCFCFLAAHGQGPKLQSVNLKSMATRDRLVFKLISSDAAGQAVAIGDSESSGANDAFRAALSARKDPKPLLGLMYLALATGRCC
jgi:hypothetical protein